MKIAILNDTHCGARNSADWMIEYQERFYKEVFFPYLEKNDIKHIIHLGDYYDSRKNAASVRALINNRKVFLDQLLRYDIMMYLILGNHDVYYKNTNSVSSPAAMMQSHPNIEIYKDPTTLEFYPEMRREASISEKPVPICLIPWINQENYDDCISEISRTNAKVCMGHFEFAGFPFQRGGIPAPEGLSTEIVEKFELVLSGHYHTRSQRGNVHYLGSQMEFTWADAGDEKYFHVYDTETGEVEEIRNPITLFQKIEFGPETTVTKKLLEELKGNFVQVIRLPDVSDQKFNNAVKKIHEVVLDVKITEPVIDKNVEVDMDAVTDTSELIKSYVDTIDTELNKPVIKSMMEALYNSALQS